MTELSKRGIVVSMREHDDPVLMISVTFSNFYVHEFERVRDGDLISYYAEIVSVSPNLIILKNGKLL